MQRKQFLFIALCLFTVAAAGLTGCEKKDPQTQTFNPFRPGGDVSH